MRKEAIQTGKTVEAAIEAACEQLGCSRESCEWEILDLPKKGLFGLKHTPARVKVSVEGPDIPAVPENKAAQRPQPKREEQQPLRQAAPQQPQKPQPPQQRPPQQPQQQQPESQPAMKAWGPNGEIPPEYAAKVQAVKEYLANILRDMGLGATIAIMQENSGVVINMQGENLGAVIGRRGETLDALQYLSGLVASRIEGEYLRVTLDCGGYRTKRKATLEALAAKLSAQVLKTNVSKTLEPMNPFERRIIHAAVSEIEGVHSTSVGEEPNRRVVITSPNARHRPPRTGDRPARPGGRERGDRERRTGDGRPNGRGGDRRGSNRGGRDGDRRGSGGARREASVQQHTQGPPKQTPESAGEGNLYSKIDLG